MARPIAGTWPAVVLLAVGGLLGVGPAAASQTSAVRPSAVLDVDHRVRCTFDTSVLGEVSGLALSRRHPDVLWATNDSGGGPYLYAVDATTCRIRARLTLEDTPARDHEALAVGTDAAGHDVVWIGDIGDNQDAWPYVRVHKVIEPAVLRDESVPVTTYRFTYPGGPTNAETLLADPDSEHLWVATKESGVGGTLYALPSPLSDSRTPMEATAVGSARATVTDGAVAPDAQRYVIRDYFTAEVFTGLPPGRALARFRLPLQPQGESVTWTADSRHLLIASEGSGDLVEVTVPGTALGEDSGLAAALPRVAGFDIYPYVRLAVLGLATVVAAVVALRWRRRVRRRRAG